MMSLTRFKYLDKRVVQIDEANVIGGIDEDSNNDDDVEIDR